LSPEASPSLATDKCSPVWGMFIQSGEYFHSYGEYMENVFFVFLGGKYINLFVFRELKDIYK